MTAPIQPGEFNVADLLRIAHSAAPVDFIGAGEFETIELPAIDGWRVAIFYDCGELDYIDHFIAPDGRELNFWDWPEEAPGRNLLMAWRGVEDTDRLLAWGSGGR